MGTKVLFRKAGFGQFWLHVRPAKFLPPPNVRTIGKAGFEAELSQLSSHAFGVRLGDWYGNPRCRFAQPGADIRQPSRLRFARRRRARKLANLGANILQPSGLPVPHVEGELGTFSAMHLDSHFGVT